MKSILKNAICLSVICPFIVLAQEQKDLYKIMDYKPKDIKEIKTIYAEQFRIVYNIKDMANANSTSIGSNQQNGVKVAAVLGVTKETLQAVTDEAFKLFQDKAKANGFEFIDNSKIQALEVYKDKTIAHKPIVYPEIMDKEDKVCIYVTPQSFVGLEKLGPMKLVKAFKNNDILTANISLTMGFVNFKAKGSKIGVQAKVTTNTELSVGGFIPCQASFMDNSGGTTSIINSYSKYTAGYTFTHKEPLTYDKEIGELVITNDGNTSFGLGSYGIDNKYRGYLFKVDQEQYKNAVLELIGKEFDFYFETLKANANK
jgi:hypothetical protein